MATKKGEQMNLENLSIEQLEQMLNQKRTASVGPLKTKYNDMAKQLAEIAKEIRKVDTEWNPPTLADRILEYVISSKSPVSLSEIKTAMGTSLTFTAMKKLVETDKVLTKGTDDKYSVTK